MNRVIIISIIICAIILYMAVQYDRCHSESKLVKKIVAGTRDSTVRGICIGIITGNPARIISDIAALTAGSCITNYVSTRWKIE